MAERVVDRAEKIKDYNVTFSVLDDKMCIPHVTVYVYGYVFYEQVDSYYLPKCFCIVSLYPLYSFFRLLTRKIYSEFEKGNKNEDDVQLNKMIEEIVETLYSLSRQRIGALIIMERETV